MKSVYYLVILTVFLASCSAAQSGNAVQTAIVQTEMARPTKTFVFNLTAVQKSEATATIQAVIDTSLSTNTKTPYPTGTKVPPTLTISQKRTEFLNITKEYLPQGVSDIEKINMVRITDNILEIEVMTKWASQDSQPIVSFNIIQFLADSFKESIDSSFAYRLFGDQDYSINIVTYSSNGDYRYESTTNNDTISQVANRSISYDEWVTASNAGFR